MASNQLTCPAATEPPGQGADHPSTASPAALANIPTEATAMQSTLDKSTSETGAPNTAALRGVIRSTLTLNPDWPSDIGPYWAQTASYVGQLCAEITISVEVRFRLAQLRDQLRWLDADEISVWALDAPCKITRETADTVPVPLGVCATVYADGCVSLYVQLDGFDVPFWLSEQLQLD